MFKIAKTPPGSPGILSKWAALVGATLTSRRELAALSALGEREFQDIGWGQRDRWSASLPLDETLEDRRDRQRALAAWRRAA